MKDFSIILAVDNENWLWNNNDLAWDIPEDRKYFKNITTRTQDKDKQNAVIMWRKTWESIPEKYRPFKHRQNFILSKSYQNNTKNPYGAFQFQDIDVCLKEISKNPHIENIFVIWGGQIYNAVLSHPHFKKAYITRIYHKYHCDTFFDGLWLDFDAVSRSEMKQYDWIEYEFLVYKKKISFFKKIVTVFKK